MFSRQNCYRVTPIHAAPSTEHILDGTPQSSRSALGPFLGLIYTFLHSFFILQTSVMVKKLTYIHPGQLSMVRNMGVFFGCLPIAIYCSKEVLGPRKYWPMLFLRSLCGATALYLNLLAYRYLPLAEASIIMSTTPSLVTIGARLYLKESCGWIQVCAILLTIAGMALSVRLPDLLSNNQPPRNDGDVYIIGICCALGCVLLLAINMVSIRKMLDVHYSVILLYFGALGTLENALLTGALAPDGFTSAYCGWDTLQVALIGVFGWVGHCFLTLAVQTEAAGVVSTLKSSIDIVLAMIFQVLFFHHSPDRYNFAGAALVLISVSVIGLRKWLQTMPDESRKKHRLRFLLL